MINKEMLEVMNNPQTWAGNIFQLAALLVNIQKEYDAAAVEELYPEAAQVIRGL